MKLIGDDKLPELLKTVCEQPVELISESTFIKKILPLIANTGNSERVDLTPWLNIGNPVNPIDVHANNDEGTILFRVPALLDNRKTPYIWDPEGESLSASVYKAIRLNTDRPGHGNNYLDNTINQSLIINPIAMDNALQWNIIFERYGLPLINIPDPIKVSSNGNATPINVQDVYEDL